MSPLFPKDRQVNFKLLVLSLHSAEGDTQMLQLLCCTNPSDRQGSPVTPLTNLSHRDWVVFLTSHPPSLSSFIFINQVPQSSILYPLSIYWCQHFLPMQSFHLWKTVWNTEVVSILASKRKHVKLKSWCQGLEVLTIHTFLLYP